MQASTYEYDADQCTGPHNPEYDGPMPAGHRSHNNDLCHQKRLEDASGNRSDSTDSDEPEDPDGNRPSKARWWKGSKSLKDKDPKGKRYVGPALVGPVPLNRKSDIIMNKYNHEYDDSDRVSIHAASNEESASEQEIDDMHSIIYNQAN